MYVCMYVCMCICVYICVYIYTHIHICMCVCVYIYIYMYISFSLYIYIYRERETYHSSDTSSRKTLNRKRPSPEFRSGFDRDFLAREIRLLSRLPVTKRGKPSPSTTDKSLSSHSCARIGSRMRLTCAGKVDCANTFKMTCEDLSIFQCRQLLDAEVGSAWQMVSNAPSVSQHPESEGVRLKQGLASAVRFSLVHWIAGIRQTC